MRALITTWLELAGLLLLVASAALVVLPWTIPGAVAVGGAGLLGISALIQKRIPKPKPASDRL